MRHKKTWYLCGVVAALASTSAEAGISIMLGDGSEATDAHVNAFQKAGGGWDIVLKSLYNPGGETTYEILGTGGAVIDSITIDVPCWKNASGECAAAGSPVFVWVHHGDATGVRSIGRIIQTGDAETSVRWAEATEDIGEVRAEDVGEVHAGRDVIGPVIATTENNSVRGIFKVIAGRDILGDVKAPNGRLGMVYASGTIGRSGAPVSIESRHIFYELHSETAIHAHVDTTVNGGDVGIWAIITPVFEGSIVAPRLPTNIYAGRAALVEIGERFAGDFLIGQGFDSPEGYMKFPRGGLEGQITFNTANQGGTPWNNEISFGEPGEPGAFALNGPGYPQTAMQLGGGSIGVAPFGLHEESCLPAGGQSVDADDLDTPVEVRLRHYGPVTWTGGPITIERREQDSTGPFTPLSTLDFGVRPADGDPNTIVVGPNVAGQGGFEPGFTYRILPTAELRADVPGLPLVQWDAPYVTTIRKAICVGDTNGTRTVDISDLLLLLSSWGPVGEFTQLADLNGDQMIDINDLLILLANWGDCP